MSTINLTITPSGAGTLAVSSNQTAASVSVLPSNSSAINLSVVGGIGPPGLGDIVLAEGSGINIATSGNVATISADLTIPANLADLADVAASAPSSGQVLTYNGSAWTPAADSTNLTGYATESFVNSAVANLVDSSPAALDTLAELAQAIGDDANFSTTITNSLASKANLSHSHNASDISGLANVATSGSYTDLADTPTTLPPAAHNHTSADISDFAAAAAANAPIQSVNNATGDITIANGTGLTLTANGSTLTLTAAIPPSNLSDLADVSGTPTADQALLYNGTEWQPGNIPAGTTVNGLTGAVVIANGTGLTLDETGQTLTLSAVAQGGDVDGGTFVATLGNVLTEGGDNLAAESSDTLTVEGVTAVAGDNIQLLRSNVAGAAPSSLLAGELAINTEDGLLYWQRANGTIASADIDLTLANVAISGSYNDLTDLPTLGTAAATNATDYATAAQGNLADSAVQPGDLADVATSGSYGDLNGTPTNFTPTAHASTHATGGSDAIAPSDIGAAPAASPTFTGTVTVPGLTSTGQILADDNVAANSVVYGFSGDTNCGIGRGGADVLTFVTAGTERLRVDSSGNVGIGTGGSALTRPLEVNQGSSEGYFSGGVWYAAHTGNGDSGFAFVRAGSAKWTIQNDYSDSDNFHIREGGFGGTARISIERTTGNVGIGTTDPASALDVNGVITVSAGSAAAPSIVASGDSNTGLLFPAADTFAVSTDGVERLRIGAGGAVAVTDRLQVPRGSAATPSIQLGGYVGDYDTGMWSPAADTVSISTGGQERVRVSSAGNVGIYAASPTAKLDINADTIRLRTAKTPASSSDTGNAGDICWDSSYLYICTATDTWRRIAHSTW